MSLTSSYPLPQMKKLTVPMIVVSIAVCIIFLIFSHCPTEYSVQFSRLVISNYLPPHGRQASLSNTNSQSLLKLMSIELVMPSNHLILCHPFPLLSIFPSIRVFSNESVLHIRWPQYWSFSFSISPSGPQCVAATQPPLGSQGQLFYSREGLLFHLVGSVVVVVFSC